MAATVEDRLQARLAGLLAECDDDEANLLVDILATAAAGYGDNDDVAGFEASARPQSQPTTMISNLIKAQNQLKKNIIGNIA